MPAARSPGLKVRTPASQAGNVGFKFRRSYCGHRIIEIKRTQFALQICGFTYGGSIPPMCTKYTIHPTDGYA